MKEIDVRSCTSHMIHAIYFSYISMCVLPISTGKCITKNCVTFLSTSVSYYCIHLLSFFFVYFHYILWRMDKWNNFLLFLGVFLDDVLTANLRSFRYYFELIVRSCSINVINKNDFTWFFLIRLSIMPVCHGKWGLIGNVLQMDFSLYFGMVENCLWHIILVDKIKKKVFQCKRVSCDVWKNILFLVNVFVCLWKNTLLKSKKKRIRGLIVNRLTL